MWIACPPNGKSVVSWALSFAPLIIHLLRKHIIERRTQARMVKKFVDGTLLCKQHHGCFLETPIMKIMVANHKHWFTCLETSLLSKVYYNAHWFQITRYVKIFGNGNCILNEYSGLEAGEVQSHSFDIVHHCAFYPKKRSILHPHSTCQQLCMSFSNLFPRNFAWGFVISL